MSSRVTFWADLLAASDSLERPATVGGLKPLATLADVEQILRSMGLDPDHGLRDPAARVYVDGAERLNQGDWLAARFRSRSADLLGWLVGEFGDSEFGVVVNRVERWHPDLAARIALLFAPASSKFSSPRFDMQLGLFMGRYEYTPFGIHTDPPGECTVHFNLGPGAKRMLFWSPEWLLEQTDGVPHHPRPGEFAEHAHIVDIPVACAATLVPSRLFHVGQTDGLAVGLTVSLKHHSDRRLGRRLAADMAVHAGRDVVAHTRSGFSAAVGESAALIRRLRSSESLRATVLTESSSLVQRYEAELRSNASFATAPVPVGVDHRCIVGDLSLAGIRGFPVGHLREANRITLYIRGARLSLTLPIHIQDALLGVIADLNEGQVVAVAQVTHALRGVQPSAVAYILSLVLSHRGLRDARGSLRTLVSQSAREPTDTVLQGLFEAAKPGEHVVVMDIDGTVLGPGAVDLGRSLYERARRQELGIVFVSARAEAERAFTETQLRAAGLSEWDSLCLRPPGTDSYPLVSVYKQRCRREVVDSGRAIVLNVGDSWHDLHRVYSDEELSNGLTPLGLETVLFRPAEQGVAWALKLRSHALSQNDATQG